MDSLYSILVSFREAENREVWLWGSNGDITVTKYLFLIRHQLKFQIKYIRRPMLCCNEFKSQP
jgi:hypothetical protein